MNSVKRLQASAVCLAAFLIAGQAVAEPVTFHFEGVIDFPQGIAGIAVGDRFVGEVTWDSNGGAGIGQKMYVFSPPLSVPGARVRVYTAGGVMDFTQDPGQPWVIYVMNDYDLSSNGVLVDEIQYFGNIDAGFRNIQIRLRDTRAKALSSTALPDGLDFAEFEIAWLTVSTAPDQAASGLINDFEEAATFTTIDHPDGVYSTYVIGINSKGNIVGFYDSDTVASSLGFVRDGHGNFTMIEIPGAPIVNPFGINDRGIIVGQYRDSTHPYGIGFIRDKHGDVTTVDIPGGVYGTAVTGIDSKGSSVGNYTDASINSHGFVRDRNGDVTIINFPGAIDTSLYGIDSSGNIVGISNDGENGNAFVLDKHGAFTIIEFPGGTLTSVNGISSRGSIVGQYYEGHPSWRQHGFVRDRHGVFTTIDVPGANFTYPSGINNRGTIVGTYYDDTPPYHHGFLMTP